MPSPRFLKNLTDRDAEDVVLTLLRLHCSEFPDWSDIQQGDEEGFPTDWEPNTMYFVHNTEDIVSRGHTYIPWAFELTLPGQGGGGSNAGLRFDNIDRRITDAIKLLPATAEISVTAETVLDVTPDLVEEDFQDFALTAVQITAVSIETTLGPNDDRLEPFCSVVYRRQTAPGLFR